MDFKLQHLDHVAIRVKDINKSAEWYERVFGLRKIPLPEWGDYPLFLLSGKTGIALFPANIDDPEIDPNSMNIKIDHFAFNITNQDFEKAIEHLKGLNIDFIFQDHFYFHSIYITDPDGHTVELTTLKVDETELYN